ncbi:MAG: MogA/MoaB family molybdenum cofactor biosynthesis protein [Deltaproteobacteria bacterium]|nr:MAG: MogA/MoaB family molybdenum cofactor biosynthesis protein [Deltaproteobacteria bacterium]
MRQAAVLTISDRGSRGEREDKSGSVVREILREAGFSIVHSEILPDDRSLIEEELLRLADESCLDLVVTTGGTGLSPEDVTPDATLAVIHRQVPGMAEAMRSVSLAKTAHAMLSRAVAGIRGQTLIINLPGSVRGARENLEVVLPALEHALDKIQGDPSECGTDHESGKG